MRAAALSIYQTPRLDLKESGLETSANKTRIGCHESLSQLPPRMLPDRGLADPVASLGTELQDSPDEVKAITKLVRDDGFPRPLPITQGGQTAAPDTSVHALLQEVHQPEHFGGKARTNKGVGSLSLANEVLHLGKQPISGPEGYIPLR